MKNTEFSKLTKAYLNKFFKARNLPYEEWNININGISYCVNNHYVIDSILEAPPEQQRMIADALFEMKASNQEINLFLKNLAIQRYSQDNNG